MNFETMLIIFILAMVMESIDSSIGMMYGTLLSPIFIGMGYSPLIVVPAILLSQGIGGIFGTVVHHKQDNANFRGLTRDTKVMLAMVVPGLFVVMLGVFAAMALPKIAVKIYIGILVLVMSSLCLPSLRYKFAWWKHYVIGILAAFNKALTGGGFGPVTSTGGIVGGLTPRVSIATTTFAEVGICISSFIVYLMVTPINWAFTLILCAGAIFGGIIGPYICSRISHRAMRQIIGIFGIISALWLLYRI